MTKKLFHGMLAAGLCWLPVMSAQAEEPAVEAAAAAAEVATSPMLPPVLVAFGDVDDALVQRAVSYAQKNLSIPVVVLKAEPTFQSDSFDEVAEAASQLIEPNRVGIVVLWRPSGSSMNHGAHFPEYRVSVANLNPMLTEGTDTEVIERRVERQVIRGICLLFNLEPSPNPQSAMFPYQNLEELDAIGRNLDPPWLKTLQKKAVDMGIELDPDGAFNMLD